MAMEYKKIAEAAKKQIDSHLQDARNLLDQGMIIKNDLYPIEIRQLETEQQILQADDAIAKARAALAEIMGLSPDTPVDIAVDRENPPPWPVPEELTAAPPEREEQKIARRMVEMAAAEESIAGGARLPKVGLTASTHYGWPGFKGNDPDWDTWWQAGVNLSWNVFDMGRRGNEQKAARAKKTRLENDREAVDRRIALDRLNARLTYEEACRRRIIGEEKVLAARENYRSRTENYRVGMASGSDYLDAHTELMTAETDLSITSARVRVAWADYMRALGMDDTGPGL
jgi:outer membrane protein TolC